MPDSLRSQLPRSPGESAAGDGGRRGVLLEHFLYDVGGALGADFWRDRQKLFGSLERSLQ